LITSLIGLWIVTGIFIDGWAHVHIPELETFFTPWHASFYSGVLVFAGWMGWQLLRVRQAGEPALQTFYRLPAGYRGAVIGVAIFGFGGACDMLWHTLLGIEASIDALLSPPHLVLLTGVLLMGTTAWRSQRALSTSASVPELISLVSVVAISSFFLNFLSPFRWSAPSLPYREAGGDEGDVIMWVGGLLVTTAVLLIPTLWQLRDGRHRIGTFTLFTAASGVGVAVAMSDHWGMAVLIPGVIGAVIGALAVDLFIAQGMWREWRYGLPIVGFAAGLLPWTIQLFAYSVTAGIEWPATLWGGSLLFTGATGAALASLVWQSPVAATKPQETRIAKKAAVA
jgi:hypothetical protein